MSQELALKNPLLGKLNALSVLAAWVCLALLIAWLVYSQVAAAADDSIVPFVLLVGALILLTIIHIALSNLVRCPHCSSQLTTQGFSRPQFGDWSSAVIRWFSGSIVCIHCGKKVTTRG